MSMDLHRSINRFRLASRELFNNYFAVPCVPEEQGFEYYDGFGEVERILFTMLVLEPCAVPQPPADYRYGFYAHPRIRVRLPIANVGENVLGNDEPRFAEILINREISSGYWDFPLDRFSNEATLLYIGFFDWESMHSRDNEFVRIQISEWPSHPEAEGKHGLVKAADVRYVFSDGLSKGSSDP